MRLMSRLTQTVQPSVKNGVTRSLLGSLQDPPNATERGRLFEQWILQEIIRLNDYQQKDWKLSFWKTSHGAEVDILISRGTKLVCPFRGPLTGKLMPLQGL